MSDEKQFKIFGEKTVRFEIIVSAKNKTAALKKARIGEIDSQEIKYVPDGFVLGSSPQVQEI